MLQNELEYYIKNQAELVKQYRGKYLVIKDQEVKHASDTLQQAYEYAKEHFELGTFIIQHCLPGKDSYTQTYHSRVIF